MDKTLIYVIIGGLAGAVVALFVTSYSVNNRNYTMMNMMGMGRGTRHMMDADDRFADDMMDDMHDDFSADDMMQGLAGLEGEEFEKTFINEMIKHHRGAIDMANLIPSRTDRPELKKLGQDIISAQSEEIDMMQEWMNSWFAE